MANFFSTNSAGKNVLDMNGDGQLVLWPNKLGARPLGAATPKIFGTGANTYDLGTDIMNNPTMTSLWIGSALGGAGSVTFTHQDATIPAGTCFQLTIYVQGAAAYTFTGGANVVFIGTAANAVTYTPTANTPIVTTWFVIVVAGTPRTLNIYAKQG